MLLWRFSGLVSFPNSQLIHPDTTTMNIMKMMKQVQQMQAGLAAAQENSPPKPLQRKELEEIESYRHL